LGTLLLELCPIGYWQYQMQPKFIAKIESEDSPRRLAVLIDADNAQASIIEGILSEIAKFGTATARRIYGDWTAPQLSSWKKVLLNNSIQPIQQFSYTTGKNATDSALIIDAMDLLYTRRFEGFCLVSSDSDFTKLAARIREEGLTVYGFGEKKTPQPFVAACDKFIYTEVLQPPVEIDIKEPIQKSTSQKSPEPKDDKKDMIDLIFLAIDAVSGDNDWANLSNVVANINKLQPSFDARLYGHKKFSHLVKSLPNFFEIDERSSSSGNESAKSIYIKKKNYKKRSSEN
jgi:NYN domain/OST-HTH/LOTUS domain